MHLVHFSSVHSNYYTAWKYATKEDAQYEEREGHADLSDTPGPSTIRAHEALQKRRKLRHKQQVGERTADGETVDRSNAPGQSERRVKRRERLTSFEVSEIIVSNNVKDRTQLLAYANMQKNEGKTVLAEFVMNRGTKVVNELFEAAWEMHKAQETLRRREKCRIDLLREAASEECICRIQGQWEVCALEVLHVNDVPPQQFRESVKVLLEKGRSIQNTAASCLLAQRIVGIPSF